MVFSKDLTQLLLVPEGKEGAAAIPDTTTSVPAGVLSHRALVTSLSVGEGSATFASENGLLYSKDMRTLIACPGGYGEAVVIPESVEAIGPDAFAGCELKSIVVRGNVKSINTAAFSNVTKAEAIIVLSSSEDYVSRSATWEAVGFTQFADLAEPGVWLGPGSEPVSESESGFLFTMLADFTLAVSWSGGAEPAKNLSIPSSAEIGGITYRVSTIAPYAFEGQLINSLSIPASITSIDEGAFVKCSELASVSFEEGLLYLDDSVFEGTALREVVLPASVVSIGERIFANCGFLNRIIALSNIPYIAETALLGSNGVSVYAPHRDSGQNGWSLGFLASDNHIFPYGVNLFDSLLLETGNSATVVDVSQSNIPEEAQLMFSYPAANISVDTEGLVSAKSEGEAEVIASLVLDETVLVQTSASIMSIKKNTAPESVQNDISSGDLSEVMPLSRSPINLIGAIVPLAGETYFTDDENRLMFRILSDGDSDETRRVEVGAVDTSISGELDIPQIVSYGGKQYRVTDIAYVGFRDCINLTGDIVIPDTVTAIGAHAFRDTLFDGTLTLPGSVKEISGSAFSGCVNLTGDLILPSQMKAVRNGAFNGCSSFSGILSIPESVTRIEDNAFAKCSNLIGALTIPPNVTYVGLRAFEGCKSLTGSLEIPSSVTYLGNEVFGGCSGLSGTLKISSTLTSLADYTFTNCTGFTSVDLGGVTSIGLGAFYRCQSLRDVYTLAPVASIHTGAFSLVDIPNVSVHLPRKADQTVWKDRSFVKFAIECAVRFDAQDGNPTPDSRLIEAGAKLKKPTDPSKNGYVFDGWYLAAEGTDRGWAFESDTVQEDMTLLARWVPIVYRIEFDPNAVVIGENVTGSMAPIIGIAFDSPAKLSGNLFTCEHFTFAGWNTAFDGTGDSYANEAEVRNLSNIQAATVTLYAQWKGKEYEIAYHSNALDVEGVMPNQLMICGRSQPLEANVFKRAGYVFLEWNTNSDGSGSRYADRRSVKNLASGGTADLYAQWAASIDITAPIDPSLTIDAKGNVGSDASTYFESRSANSAYIAEIVCSEGSQAAEILPRTSDRANLRLVMSNAAGDEVSFGLGKTVYPRWEVAAGSSLSPYYYPVVFSLRLPQNPMIVYREEKVDLAGLSFTFALSEKG